MCFLLFYGKMPVMEELKDTIAKNLVELRTQAHMTQLQLAEMLNYSDKAVSKWERGEAVPDVRVLAKIAEIYGVTIDDIVKEERCPPARVKKKLNGKHIFVTALAAILVWFIATAIFMIFYFIDPTEEYSYLVFVVAPLPTAIVLVVFSAIWGNRITHAVASSLVVWACAVILHVFVSKFAPDFMKIYFIYIIAAVLEILIIVWFVYRWYVSKHGKLLKNHRKKGE